jgi:heterodisulfide reductase subunit C
MGAVDRKVVEKLLLGHGLSSCFECGKCTASCPLSEIHGDVAFGRTPRGIIEMALLDPDSVLDEAIWHCLTCDVCAKGCPCGVRFRDFVEALRAVAIEAGYTAHAVSCRKCGRYLEPDSVLGHVVEMTAAGAEPPAYLFLCPRCRSREFGGKVKSGRPDAPERGET